MNTSKNPPSRHVTDQLSAYLDYELPEAERAAVREHLDRCPACENELATLRATKQVLSEVPPVALPRTFILGAEQAAALRTPAAARPTLAPARSRLPRLVWGLRLGATAALMLFLGLFSLDVLNRPTASVTMAPLSTQSRNLAVPTSVAARIAAATGAPTLAPDAANAGASMAQAAPTNTPAIAADQALGTTSAGAAAVAPTPEAANVAAAVAAPTTTTAAAAAIVAVPAPAGGAPPATPNSPTAAAAFAPAAGGAAAMETAIPATADTSVPPAAVGKVPAAVPTAPGDQFAIESATVAAPELHEATAPPAPPPTLHWLPWEIGLGLLAFVLAAASIFLPRRDT